MINIFDIYYNKKKHFIILSVQTEISKLKQLWFQYFVSMIHILTVKCAHAMKRIHTERRGAWKIADHRNDDAREISTHRMMKYKLGVVMTRNKCPTFLGYMTNKNIKQTKTDDKYSSNFLKNLRRWISLEIIVENWIKEIKPVYEKKIWKVYIKNLYSLCEINKL